MGGSIQRSRGRPGYVRAVHATNNKPANTALPVITGTKSQGQTLTCSAGTWTRTPALAYQWRRNGDAIAGATAATRVLAALDVGAQMSCTVTATKAGVSASVTTASTTPIGA